MKRYLFLLCLMFGVLSDAYAQQIWLEGTALRKVRYGHGH